LKNPQVKIVIADVRFQNEVDMVNNLKGCVFKIQRDFELLKKIDEHESEKNIDTIINYSSIIYNNSTIEDLYIEINKLIIT
jgi:hypothetical protein